MSDLYNQLCNMLIRPTRQTYHMYDLGNPIINIHGKRQDFQILSRNNLKIKCSFYKSLRKQDQKSKEIPTLIYLHSFNGSRLEFLTYVQPLLKMGFHIATLDFAGCGLSEGDFVTLGAREKWDVLSLVIYIYKTYKLTSFMIWGRSMGAVAAIKFYTLLMGQRERIFELRNIKILGLVLDSPFISLNQLAIQIAKNKISMPQILIKMAFFMIQNSIEQKANFKTSQLELQDEVYKINAPTLIITSKKDTLVSYQHSLSIYNKILSIDKQLMYIQSEHNNNRQQKDILKVLQFLYQKSTLGQFSINFSKNKPVIQLNNVQNNAENSQKIKSKSLKKYQNSVQSKDRLNRYQSQKNQIHFTKNNSFFQSNVTKDKKLQIYEQMEKINFNSVKTREYSQQKVILQSGQDQKLKKQIVSKNYLNENYQFHSADRQRISFFQQSFHKSCAINAFDRKSQQSFLQNKSIQQKRQNRTIQKQRPQQKSAPILESIPQTCQKSLKHALSYKNIECLKTVKKIKRLQPQYQQDQTEDVLKNHMNVITAKLKKKSKNGLTKSFLPTPLGYQKPKTPQNQRTLKKQVNAKSSTNLIFNEAIKSSHVNNSFQKYVQVKRQRPTTPVFFSNRQIFNNQQVQKPFTPQFPLNSSMRINQMTHKRENSKEHIYKLYSMQPIPQSNKGIKTTLTSKNILNDQNRYQNQDKNKYQSYPKDQKQYQSLLNSVQQSPSEHKKVEFMSSKKMLSSQIMQMRASNNFEECKKFIVPKKNYQNSLIDRQQETSISLNN